MQQADVLEIERLTTTVSGVPPRRERFLIEFQGPVVLAALRAHVGQVCEVISRLAGTIATAIEG